MILDVPLMHWAVAGATVAALTLLLAFVFNRRLGFSSGFEDICSLAISLPRALATSPTAPGARRV